MGWQQALSLVLVLGAAVFLLVSRMRARTRVSCSQGCSCPAGPAETPGARSSTPA